MQPQDGTENPRAATGSNSGVAMNSDAREEVTTFAERIIRLTDERKALNDDLKELRAEIKSRGYDVKSLLAALKLSQRDQAERAEEERMVNLFLSVLGVAELGEDILS